MAPNESKPEKVPGRMWIMKPLSHSLAGLALLLVLLPAAALGGAISGRDQGILVQALEAVKADDYARARQISSRASDPRIGKIVRWIDLTRRGTDAEFAEIAGFLEQNPHWPRKRSLRRNAEAAMPPGLRRAEMLAWFEAHAPLSAPGVTHYGTALLNASRKGEATKMVREAWVRKDFTAAQEKTFRKRFMKLLKRQDFIDRLDRLLWDGRESAARRQALRLGKGYARLAEARLVLAQRNPGVDYALKRVPGQFRHDSGLRYERSRWRLRKGRPTGAIEILRQKTSKDRTHPGRWWQLRAWAAREALQMGHYNSAYSMATKHNSKSGVAFAEGEWLAGWIALSFLKQPKRAYEHFTRLYEGVASPISLSRGAYWAGTAALKLGRKDWAQRWFELAAKHGTAFYGQLASQHLGQPLSVKIPAAGVPSEEPAAAFKSKELVQVVQLLARAGAKRRIDPFVYQLLSEATGAQDFVLIAELADRAGRPDLGIQAAKKARRAGFVFPERLFPLPGYAKLPGDPDPALVLALIRQESAFDAEAISPAGARGLMQLMPGTAKREAAYLEVHYSKGWLTSKPDYNMKLGRTHLQRLLEDYRGSLVLVLAAYNAGASRVSKWMDENGDPRRRDVDSVQWIELIPFKETRNYVQRVLEGRSVYRLRLGITGTPLPLEPATAKLYKSQE